jgi:hypothetical protein
MALLIGYVFSLLGLWLAQIGVNNAIAFTIVTGAWVVFGLLCWGINFVLALKDQRDKARWLARAKLDLTGITVQNPRGLQTGLHPNHWLDRGVVAIAAHIILTNLTNEHVQLNCSLGLRGVDQFSINPLSEDDMPPAFIPSDKWRAITDWLNHGFWLNRGIKYLSSPISVPPGWAYQVNGCLLFAIDPDQCDSYFERFKKPLADAIRSDGIIGMSIYQSSGDASPYTQAVHGISVIITR